MRTGPSTSAAIITRLAPGTEVVVHYEKDGWAYITANGRTGYVSTQYLINARNNRMKRLIIELRSISRVRHHS